MSVNFIHFNFSWWNVSTYIDPNFALHQQVVYSDTRGQNGLFVHCDRENAARIHHIECDFFLYFKSFSKFEPNPSVNSPKNIILPLSGGQVNNVIFYVAEVQNVRRTIFFLLRSISLIHRGMETYINRKITLGKASPAGFIREWKRWII